jgi:replicative DNA helicase
MDKLERATNRAEVLVKKHRHGATRAIDLVFEGSFTPIQQYGRRVVRSCCVWHLKARTT